MTAPVATEDDVQPKIDLRGHKMITYSPESNARLRIINTSHTLGEVVGDGNVVICFLSMAWLKANQSEKDLWQRLSLMLGTAQSKGARVVICMTHYCYKFYRQVFAEIPDAFALHGITSGQTVDQQIYWLEETGRARINLGDDPSRVILLRAGTPIASTDEKTPYDLTPILETLDPEIRRLSA